MLRALKNEDEILRTSCWESFIGLVAPLALIPMLEDRFNPEAKSPNYPHPLSG